MLQATPGASEFWETATNCHLVLLQASLGDCYKPVLGCCRKWPPGAATNKFGDCYILQAKAVTKEFWETATHCFRDATSEFGMCYLGLLQASFGMLLQTAI